MKGWTAVNIEALERKGLKVEYSKEKTEFIGPKVKQKAIKAKQEPEGLRYIKQHLQLLKIDFVTEYRFDEKRKFRFDVAIVQEKIALEYEGLNSEKSRHTTLKGYSNDSRKYNLATRQGWKVFRYTAITYKEFLNDIEHLIK